ncbi:hypothetical protein BOX15_Mlig007662g1 [Macrostomum lignano]|uniref:C2H2-type domain-containing protein n=2 Tax=Macrostomum lignano TaxID=282301 RepID=A0A267DKC9_9PLAT|nr:hypothetical protein BOX15_Mlig007662g1 [Macrostomum lignano]
MQQRRRDRGGIAIRHRLSAISEASDDRATSSADDEEINTSIAEVREFHEQFGRDSGGRSSASHRSGKRFATLMRPQPEGLAGEPLTQRVTQLDEQRDYQPALLGLPGLPAGGLVTAVASSSARILDCTSATAPAAAASEEEVEVRVTAEATGPNPSVALARAAARAAGAASAAVKKSRSVRSHCVNASEAESEYRIFISTSCTLREPQRLDGDGKLKNVMSSTQPPTEEDIVEIFQVAPELQEYQRWAVTGAGDVEFTFISDSEPGSPTPDVEENPQPSSRSQQQSALLQATPGQQQEQQQQQQRGRLPGPNSLQADQRRLQAARDAYAAVKTVPARPRPSLSLPRLSNSVSNGAAGATSVVNHQRWSDVSTSSGSLRQLRRLLGDDEAVYASHSMTDGLVVDQQQSRELQQRSQPSVTAPKSVSLSDLLDSDVGNSGSIDADVSHSCASLLETDNINTLTSNESLKQSLKRLKLPSSRRAAADQAKVRSASLFFEWLEQRANSERERSICRSLTRLEAPVWLDNLAKDAPGPLDTSLRVKENRNSWRPSATSIEPSSLIKGSVDDITWKTRPIHGSLSLPMRLSKQTNRSSDHGKASSTDGNLRIKQTSAGTDRLDGSISNRARFFTESSLSRQVRQAAAAQPRPPTLSELAARLHRPPLLPVTLTPEDFQPKARAQTMPEEIQPMSSSDASAGQKRDSGASMASLTSSSSTTSTSSNSQSSSATTSSETGNSEAAEKTEESTVVQTSIVQVYTRVLHPTVNHGPVTQHSDAELLPGLLACQVDPTGPSTENDLMTAPKLLKLAEAQIERQRSRLAEWQNDAAEGRPTTARQEELLAVNDEVLRYFRVNSGGPDRADRRPESPSLAYDDVLQVLGDYEASSKLSRVLVALSGTRERKLQQPQRSLAEACHGVIREGQHYLLECANPSCARRCDLDRRLANGFHSCRECRTFYCSQKCRSDHARAHGRSCCWNRRVDACKRVIAGCLLADTSPAVVLLSRLARASSRSFGWRGCLLLALRDSAAAARFVTTDGKEGLMRPPALLDLSTLSGDLADASKSCNPDAAFVVCVVVGTGVKWAKLRLSARTKQTRIQPRRTQTRTAGAAGPTCRGWSDCCASAASAFAASFRSYESGSSPTRRPGRRSCQPWSTPPTGPPGGRLRAAWRPTASRNSNGCLSPSPLRLRNQQVQSAKSWAMRHEQSSGSRRFIVAGGLCPPTCSLQFPMQIIVNYAFVE